MGVRIAPPTSTPAEATRQASAMSAVRAPQTSASTGRLAITMTKPKNTVKRRRPPESAVRFSSASSPHSRISENRISPAPTIVAVAAPF